MADKETAKAENESSIPGHLENLAAGNNPGAFESSPPREGAFDEENAEAAEAVAKGERREDPSEAKKADVRNEEQQEKSSSSKASSK